MSVGSVSPAIASLITGIKNSVAKMNSSISSDLDSIDDNSDDQINAAATDSSTSADPTDPLEQELLAAAQANYTGTTTSSIV